MYNGICTDHKTWDFSLTLTFEHELFMKRKKIVNQLFNRLTEMCE